MELSHGLMALYWLRLTLSLPTALSLYTHTIVNGWACNGTSSSISMACCRLVSALHLKSFQQWLMRLNGALAREVFNIFSTIWTVS